MGTKKAWGEDRGGRRGRRRRKLRKNKEDDDQSVNAMEVLVSGPRMAAALS